MGKFEVVIGHGKESEVFEVRDNKNHGNSQCQFEVFRNEGMVLSLEPEGPYLRTCNNPGNLAEETIYQIIAKIKSNRL
ncbi:MAG TPA: hypothetical protein VK609_03900 [Mucilaginibacter sp.]|nr:hypothetical protein [Mucilaginibacter sp.]